MLPAIIGLAGVAASLYGANQQAKATEAANAANLAAQKESERQDWIRYLMTRGINPGAGTQAGELPGYAPGSALNTRLPMWATINVAPDGSFVPTRSGSLPGARPPPPQFIRR